MLWTAFRSGDEKAFITIFDRFTRPLFNYGCKIISDQDQVKDGIQELFIELWQNKTRLGDTDSIKFYLFKSLRRKLLRVKAKKSNNPLPAESLLDQESNHGVSPSHELILIGEQISAEKKEKVILMLSQLSKRQQEVLFLRYFEELSCDQIAVVMHISKQAVYNLIHHALEELRTSNFSVRHFEE